ncbi:MAG: hypothetical protein B7Y84_02280 [Azorhizobium sp. 32-67-21]|nr:MAG: hypothetical protein B7Z30_00755 [Rhizobiales bacterium 12-68-15]OYX90110.1 MAG: hypothetical protein B7Y84_02280 [Azorhizobium sp. 32-67-21]
MTSIMTNTSAQVALQTLRGINSNLDTTSERISSGLKIANASDNAAYWSIATTMKSDGSALGAVTDSLSLGSSIADAAYNGLDQAKELLGKIKDKLTTAAGDGVDRAAVQEEITTLQEQLKTVASTSSFSGQNWLEADAASTKKIVSSVSRDSDNALAVSTIDVDTTDLMLYSNTGNAGILDKSISVDSFDSDSGAAATFTTATFGATDKITFSVSQNGGVAKTVTIDQATVQAALSGESTIASKADLKAVLEKSFENADVQGITVDTTGNTTFTSTEDFDISGASVTGTGADLASLGLSATDVTTGAATVSSSVAAIDISAVTDSTQVQNYLKIVDEALSQVTSAAASVGAVQTRIGTQKDLVSSLSDTISTGVGSLIDANMEEESTKLKALQTQQQLAVQSLSIANSSSQNILSLFR